MQTEPSNSGTMVGVGGVIMIHTGSSGNGTTVIKTGPAQAVGDKDGKGPGCNGGG